MKKDWRQTKWKDFTSKQRMWFSLLCVSLVCILVVASLSTSDMVDIPDWLILGIVAVGVVPLYKFLQLTPWALMGLEDEEDEDT